MERIDDPSDGPHPVSGSSTDREAPEDVDELFQCLADHRRRLLLEGISERSEPVALEALAEYIREREDGRSPGPVSDDEVDEITIALFHNHLPKLSESGVIEIDHGTNTVRKGARFETARKALQVI